MKEEERKLIEEALGGSQRAYKILTERHQKAVFHIIIKIVRDTETANDLVQETANLLRPEAREHNVDIEIVTGKDIPLFNFVHLERQMTTLQAVSYRK